MKKLLFTTLLLGSLFTRLLAVTDICDISIGPDSKVANYAHNQNVTVTMGYSTDEATGVRIFARPFSGGSLSPGYSGSGSGLYLGSGTASSSFTIMSGNVLVDEIRIEVYASDNSTLLRRMWIPVRFRFGNVGVNNFNFASNPTLSSLLLGENFSCTFHYNISYPGGVRIFVRPFTNGGLSPGYSGSGSGIYSGNGTDGGGAFTINSGKNVLVDAIRVKIVSADQSVDIDEFFIPVKVYFSTVKITEIIPQTGNFPFNNEDRQLSFAYSTTEPAGIRVFPRPWTNGALTPNYAASGSPLYSGMGNGGSTFTITAGNQRVDHVRFNVTNATQSETLLEFWSPVDYTFGNFLIAEIQLCPPAPARLENGEPVKIHYGYYNDEGQNTRIFVRPFTNGSLSPGYAASGSGDYPVGGGVNQDFFTITSGDVKVDQLRFQITNANQTAILAEYFIPVNYVFGNPTSAISELEERSADVSIFPNPSFDQARISVTLKERSPLQVTVTDLTGKVVASLENRLASADVTEFYSINTSVLSAGIYLVIASGDNFKETCKLVVMK